MAVHSVARLAMPEHPGLTTDVRCKTIAAEGKYLAWLSQAEEYPLDQLEVAAYFHLQHCIDGFGQLLKTLMGVSLTKVPLAPG